MSYTVAAFIKTEKLAQTLSWWQSPTPIHPLSALIAFTDKHLVSLRAKLSCVRGTWRFTYRIMQRNVRWICFHLVASLRISHLVRERFWEADPEVGILYADGWLPQSLARTRRGLQSSNSQQRPNPELSFISKHRSLFGSLYGIGMK